MDVSPEFPVRLSGYGNRHEQADTIAQPIWAKALAVSDGAESVFVLLSVDNCGLTYDLREDVLAGLRPRGVTRESLVISFSHTHSGPCTTGALENLFSAVIPASHQANIDRYTSELTAKIIAVAEAAIDAMRPANLEWGQGKLRFATNRRERRGPIDHDFPIMVVREADNSILAIIGTYACHATALGPNVNEVHGDWLGLAQAEIEKRFPGATALMTVGCAGESIPWRLRDLSDDARLAQMQMLAEGVAMEVEELIEAGLAPLNGLLAGRIHTIDLPLRELPTRSEWEELADDPQLSVAYHAQKNLARLDAGETLPTAIPYHLQSWQFGEDLAMLFMAGEVLADYSLGLKRHLDAGRVWVHAYSNDATAYIPSRRSLVIGGYEAVASTRLYDLPQPFAPTIEDMVMNAAIELVGPAFSNELREDPIERATTPEEALAALQPRFGTEVELVASEPQVYDPISVAFGRAGSVFVVEMRDYPMGMDGNWQAGGVIRRLSDPDGHGTFREATVFVDNLPFPTGVMEWRDGLLICAAPDLLYAQDTDGDGKADELHTLLTGFATDNFQSRLNGLSLGLDGWVYLGAGSSGGIIFDPQRPEEKIDVRGYDVRIDPDTREFELVSGWSKFGRVRDDWGNWFASTPSVIATHYPYEYRYLKRNPHARLQAGTLRLDGGERARLYPVSRPMQRFNQPGHVNHATAACGLGIYRDDWLGTGYVDNVFTAEPVSSLITRRRLVPDGALFDARRANDEQESEFLASTSAWFTPVEVRLGPDGGLWIVDMTRPVIEHPRWIPPERLANLDVRAGEGMGRIFRVLPGNLKRRDVPDLTALGLAELVAMLDSPNGVLRDLVHKELLIRADHDAVPLLDGLMATSDVPAVRGHALAVILGLGEGNVSWVKRGLLDPDPRVRELALRLGDSMLKEPSELDDLLPDLADSNDVPLLVQLAFSLGEWHDEANAAKLLAQLALAHLGDDAMQTAVVSSALRSAPSMLATVLADPAVGAAKGKLVRALISTAIATQDDVSDIIAAIAEFGRGEISAWQLTAAAELQRALDRRGIDLRKHFSRATDEKAGRGQAMKVLYAKARDYALEASAPIEVRRAAVELMGGGMVELEENLPSLVALLDSQTEPQIMIAAVEVLGRGKNPTIARSVVERWDSQPPSIRPRLLNLLLSREQWMETLVTALDTNRIAAKSLPADALQRLLSAEDASLRQRAKELFARGLSADRMKVVDSYAGVERIPGNALRGAEVFLNNCSVCHVFVGQSVGPPLNNFRGKSIEDLLMAIFNPNAAVEPAYAGYQLTMKDGSSLAGVIQGESPSSITLLQPGNISREVLRADVANISSMDTSFMPEGLEATMNREDLADLFAYISEAENTVGPRDIN